MSNTNEHAEVGAIPMSDNGPKFTNLPDMLKYLEMDAEMIQDVENGIAKRRGEQREHAEVGALLAKCDLYDVERFANGWMATVMLVNGEYGCTKFGCATQLAAIRAAVEAAEKGVRE